jgi:predicted MPP superfamily phosphohydrolase
MFRGLQVFVSGIALAGFTLAGAAVASAQEPAQEPAKVVLPLEGDATVMIVLIKPDKTADFEAVIAKYKEALAKNDKAARKEQLAGIKIYKSPTAMGGNTAYIFSVDPVVKGEEYDITRVINEVFPSEVTDYFNKYKDAYAGRQIIVLNKIP